MKRVAVVFLTTSWGSSYSLVSVVKNQINLLVKQGYSPRVLTLKGCEIPALYSRDFDFRPCLPVYMLRLGHNNRFEVPADFGQAAIRIGRVFEKNLSCVDVVFCHDVLFLDQHLAYNVAVRKASARLHNLRWFHWTHSNCSPPPKKVRYPFTKLYESMPNSTFVAVADAQKRNIASRYGVNEGSVTTVYNYRATPEFMGSSRLSRKIIGKGSLLDADIVSVYPSSVDRAAKQFEVCLFLMAALKEEGKRVRFVIADAFTRNKSKDRFKSAPLHMMLFKWIAEKIGLTETDLIFTSSIDKKLANGCSESVVRDLFQVSNVFIHPSVSEACSLILFEAALAKNLCVLNWNVPAFREIGKTDVLLMKFKDLYRDANRRFRGISKKMRRNAFYYKYYLDHYAVERKYYRRCARRIIAELEKSKALAFFARIKNIFNENRIFDNQLKKLIETHD